MTNQLENDCLIASEEGFATAMGEDFMPTLEQQTDADTLRDLDEVYADEDLNVGDDYDDRKLIAWPQ